MKHGARKENRKDVLGKRTVVVNEMYIMEGNTVIGWTEVNKVMTVAEINRLFKSGKILTVNVKNNDKEYWGRDYNYKTFRIAYPTLETYFERLVEEAIFKVKYENRFEFDEKVITFRIADLKIWRANGIYIRNIIEIDENYLLNGIEDIKIESDIIRTIIHEIGHHVHRFYFDDKQFRLPTQRKTKYAYKNYLENFAEAFADLMVGRIAKERNAKMEQILMNV